MMRLVTVLGCCCGLTLLGAPVAAGDEAPPCAAATSEELRFVEVAPSGEAILGGRAGGAVKAHVVNRTGKVICRLLVQVSLDGKERPGTCAGEDGVKPGGEADVRCGFTLLAGESRGVVVDRGSRRPGMPGRGAPPKVRLKVEGAELSDPAAWRRWEEKRAAAARRAAEQAAASKAGFQHSFTITRAADGKSAREQVERAMGRLRDCVLERARRNPKLELGARLAVRVSRGRRGAEPLLAVKVLTEKGLGPEVRECLAALELVELPAGSDFEAVVDVSYRPER
jgi:hypothetical protein